MVKNIQSQIHYWLDMHKAQVGVVLVIVLLIGASIKIFDLKMSKSSTDKNNSLLNSIEQENLDLKDQISDLAATVSELTDRTNQLIEAHHNPVISTITKTKTVANNSSANDTQGQVAGASTSSTPVSGKININSASVDQLDSLPGIGPTYANRIIEYRTANGNFKSIEDIKNVKGIGDKTFEKFKDKITI